MKENKQLNAADRSNPFTLAFGSKPFEYVSRLEDAESLVSKIKAEPPVSHCFIITGVRGSGKTVMLTTISRVFEEDSDWIVVDLNSEDDLLSRMFDEIQKRGKRVLVTIDEASNNAYMKKFALSFQMLTRADYPLIVVATGLFENISSLENEANMTFLIRALKTYLSPLNVSPMAASYEASLGIDRDEALKCAKTTKGYAFAFQLLGYLMFESHTKTLNSKLLAEFDQYLSEYAYTKIWATLSNVEREIVSLFKSNSSVQVSRILKEGNMEKNYFSRYRERLLKKGIIASTGRGKLTFALPRFKEFVESQDEE